MKLIEVLKEHSTINHESFQFEINYLSNIVPGNINKILEVLLAKESIKTKVKIGEFNNYTQESFNPNNSSIYIVHIDSLSLTNDISKSTANMSADQALLIEKKVISEIDIIYKNLSSVKKLIFIGLSKLVPELLYGKNNQFHQTTRRINNYLYSLKNIEIINLDRITSSLGLENSINKRDLYSFSIPYTHEFQHELSINISNQILSTSGKIKKCLVLDCDNTLWGGIIGEDGESNLQINKDTNQGKIFLEIQHSIKKLSNEGTIICLCSKNNEEDLLNFFKKNIMPLSIDDITAYQINWNDKASNIRALSKTLNIGLDSMVFLDDSEFEVELVRNELPEVLTIQVPKNTYDYPQVFSKVVNIFYKETITTEDKNKKDQYKQNFLREKEKESFGNIDDYLKSLNIELKIFQNKKEQLERLAQLTQKTNQFNLTTKRYTITDIQSCFDNDFVFSFSATDKLGDSGIVGMTIIKKEDEKAIIDTLLLSCRILGRRIEEAFFIEVLDFLKDNNFKKVIGEYIPTQKNQMTKNFYSNFKFSEVEENRFELDLTTYNSEKINFIKVSHE